MRIFHVSDTHLGFSAFAKLDPNGGLNQRETDLYDSFKRFIDICLDKTPDLVLHTGDLFDSVRPSNRAISFAMEQIKRLSEAGIPFIAISGNHETPRLKETGNVFKILEHIPNCQFVYEGDSKKINIGGIEIICIPHATEDLFKRNVKSVSESKKDCTRIIMMHAGILGLGVFRTNEINELILDSSDLDSTADYIALGHYHNFVEVTRNCCYAGSTERLSISETGIEKGFVDIDITGKKRKFVELPTRKMIDFPAVNVKNLNASDVKSSILRIIESGDIDGAIVRMTIKNLSKETEINLDLNTIRKAAQSALNFELRKISASEEGVIQSETPHIGKLEDEFKQYLSRLSIDKLDKKILESMATEFFAEKDE